MSHPLRRDYGHLQRQDDRQSPMAFGRALGFSLEQVCAAYLADPWRIPPMELPWALCDMQCLLEVLRENKVPLLPLAGPALALGETIAMDFGDTIAGSSKLQSAAMFQAAREAEAEALAELRAEYKQVHEALAPHGIMGVLIKSVGLEPSLPFKSDNLDVLYKPQDVEQVRSTLCQLGYVELRNMEEPHKYLFRKFHAGRSVSAIHVHAHVGWMTSFLDEEKLWQRCRPADDEDWVTIPAPEDALLTTLAHWFYEDKRLVLQDVVKCAHCLRQGVDWDEICRIATWRGWRDGLDVALLLFSYQENALYGQTLVPSSILEGAWRGIPVWARVVLEHYTGAHPAAALPASGGDTPRAELGAEHRPDTEARQAATPLPIPFLFSKVFSYAKLCRDPSRSAARRAKDLVVHTAYGIKSRLHIHSQPAMLVTFSGVDGSGKTTQARAMQSAFDACLLRADYTWSRGGSASWIAFLNQRLRRDLSRWIRRLTGVAQTPPRTERGMEYRPEQGGGTLVEAKVQARQQQFRSPWKRWAWSWLTVGELSLQYTRRVTMPLLRGRVVICDRYVDDALADWSAYFGHAASGSPRGGEEPVGKSLAARVLGALTPRPSLAYWLDVAAEVAQSRSPDGLPARFLDAQSAVYRRWADASSAVGLNEDGVPTHLPFPYPLQRLDGSQGWEEICDQVVYDVLSAYFASYWTWVNWLFWKNPGQWR